MANEARVFAEGPGNSKAYQFTVADGTAIAKGTLLVANATTRTGVAHSGIGQKPLGYTTESKEANDGFTEIGCQVNGVVVAYVDGSVATGDVVVCGSTANRVRRMDISTGVPATSAGMSYQEIQSIVGRALETKTDGQQCRIALSIFG